jgi:GNAT superfamily N-acetyltransferase
MSDALEQAIASFFTAMEVLTTSLPEGVLVRQGATVAMITGLRAPALNAVVTESVEPDVAAISDLATAVRTTSLPWSIQVRGGVGGGLTDLAVANGLPGRRALPFMICAAERTRLRHREVPGASVTRVGVTGWKEHGRALDLGFETGGDVLAPFTEGTALDTPGWVAYAVEIDGAQVATALGVHHEATVGVFNVSVLPGLRGRGLGRIITERVLTEGFDAGATLAYLQPSLMAEPMYRSMGFDVAETWTVFS